MRAPVGGRRLDADAEEDSALMVRNTKQKRRPNSATSGGMMLGRISRNMIQRSALAAQPRRLDKIHDHDIHGDGAGQAEHAGRIEQRRG